MSEFTLLAPDAYLPRAAELKDQGQLTSLWHIQGYPHISPGIDGPFYDKINRGEAEPDELVGDFFRELGALTVGGEVALRHTRVVHLPKNGGITVPNLRTMMQVLELEATLVPRADIGILPFDPVETPAKLAEFGADPELLEAYMEGVATDNPQGPGWVSEGGPAGPEFAMSWYQDRQPGPLRLYSAPMPENVVRWVAAWRQYAESATPLADFDLSSAIDVT